MKKVIILTTVIALSLAFAGCGKKNQDQAQKQEKNEAKGLQVKENNSLLGWMKRGKAVECRIETPEGAVTMIAKDNKVRIEGIPYFSPDSSGEAPKAENGAMLTTEEWTYVWDKAKKKGTKMNNKKIQEMAGNAPEDRGNVQKDWQEMVKSWEAAQVKYDCREISIPESEVSEPAGVEFTDFTEILSGFEKIGEKLEAQTKDGAAPDMKALEEIADKLKEQGVEELPNIE